MIDLFWNAFQDNAINELQESVSEAHEKNAALVKRLGKENRELQLRLGVLIRLLIDRGVFKAEDYTALHGETKARLGDSALG